MLCGQEGNFGTGSFKLYLNTNNLDDLIQDDREETKQDNN